MGFADLHLHTIYSYDGTAPVSDVLRRARQVGLDVIAITDHDEIRGSLRARDLAARYGIEVIPAVEITTRQGDLLALFVERLIPARLPLIETILRVQEQGGLCIVPHPLAGGLAMKSLTGEDIRAVLRDPDAASALVAIETYNATALDRQTNVHAPRLAREFGLPGVGNSDAHSLDAIGLGRTWFAGSTAADLRQALIAGETVVRRVREWDHARILAGWAAGFVRSMPARVGQLLALL